MAGIIGTLHEDICTFVIICRCILLRMRNVSDKICRENKIWEIMVEPDDPQMKKQRMLFACCIINSYLLTPWSRALLENRTGFQLVKKFPAFCGTRKFITAFTSARHMSLSSASLIQSKSPTPPL